MKMQTGKEKNYFGRSSDMIQYYAASTHSSLKDRVSPKVHPFTAQWRVFPEISKKNVFFQEKALVFSNFSIIINLTFNLRSCSCGEYL